MSYLKNLLIALTGRDPYRAQLEEVVSEYNKTVLMAKAQDERIFKLEERAAKDAERLLSFQDLTENLRRRVTEKEAAMQKEWNEHVENLNRLTREHAEKVKTLKREHEAQVEQLKQQHERANVDRHEEYEAKLNGLREDIEQTTALLQKANKAMATNIMAQSMLDKTNNGLDDLCAAMASGDVETVLAATQYLDWSNHLVRIAQSYLSVLRRKNELEERLLAGGGEDENVNFD